MGTLMGTSNSSTPSFFQSLPRAVPRREGEPDGGEREVRWAAAGRGKARRQDRRQQDEEAIRLLPRAAAHPKTIPYSSVISGSGNM